MVPHRSPAGSGARGRGNSLLFGQVADGLIEGMSCYLPDYTLICLEIMESLVVMLVVTVDYLD